MFVSQDRPAEVAETAELRHQALIAEQSQQLVQEARHLKDSVANEARTGAL